MWEISNDPSWTLNWLKNENDSETSKYQYIYIIEIYKPNPAKHHSLVIYKALCFDVAQGRMNGAPNETRTHSCRFASQAC